VGEHRLFGVPEARALLPEVRRRVEALIEARADLTELSVDLRHIGSSVLGGCGPGGNVRRCQSSAT